MEITTTLGHKLVKVGEASEAILWPTPGPKVLIVSPDFSTRAPTLCVRGAGHVRIIIATTTTDLNDKKNKKIKIGVWGGMGGRGEEFSVILLLTFKSRIPSKDTVKHN